MVYDNLTEVIKLINFAVGPVMMDEEIRDIAAKQLPYFRTNEFSKLIIENKKLLIKCLNANDLSSVIFLTASGTAAMEASIINLITNSDKILIVNGGSFGKRFADICKVHELNYEEIHLSFGESLTNKHLDPYEDKGFTAFLINVHETTTGVLYDMNLVKDFCNRNNLFLIVDAISSFLADPYDMQGYGVNTTIISSQKGLALPPGMSYVIVDDIAKERIYNNTAKSLYFNFKDYLVDGERGQTPYTPAVCNLIQLRKRLEMICEYGVDNIVNKTASLANDFRNKIKELPMEITSLTLSNALTPIKPLGKMTADEIFRHLKDNYDIFICPNGGVLAKKMFRVGHIGALTELDNDILINAFKEMNDRGIL